MKRATDELIGTVRSMLDTAFEHGHQTVWATSDDEEHLIYFTFNPERAKQAIAALREAGCLCETFLGRAETVKATEDVPAKRLVYKYELLPGKTTIQMPRGAKLLSVGRSVSEYAADRLYVWALVDANAPAEPRVFHVVPTGKELPDVSLTHVGTAHGVDGWMVFHVFEERGGR